MAKVTCVANVCMGLFSVFAGWSEVGEPSTDSQRSHASLPPESMNHAVQHLRGFRLTPGVSPAVEFIEFTPFIYIYICFLMIIKKYQIVSNQKEF